MEKKLLLLLNPCAGQRKANRLLTEILRILMDAGYRCEVYITNAAGDAAKYAETHASEFSRMVCVGGDGTLNETIAGVLRSGISIPIGYIPAGTTNDYAGSLGLSPDLLQAAQDAVNGRICRLDVGSFNGRYFTYAASCGAFTKASYSTPQSLKNSIGHLAYILEGIKDLPSLRPFHLRVETERSVLDDDFLFCSVTNSTSVGGILKLDSEMVSLNDGLFEVMLVRNPTTPIQLSSILHALTTLEMPNEMVHFFSAQRICVESEEGQEWTLDGEHAQGTPRVEMVNLRSAVQIVVPKMKALNSNEENHENQLSD